MVRQSGVSGEELWPSARTEQSAAVMSQERHSRALGTRGQVGGDAADQRAEVEDEALVDSAQQRGHAEEVNRQK